MISLVGLIPLFAAFMWAPLLLSVINRTKALVAGRRGPPWSQPYRELWKLIQKGAVYSSTTTVLFRAGPIVSCTAIALALSCMPLGDVPALMSFPGDFLVVVYLLGLARFMTILAALDTGSSFEGMGASREAFFSVLVEPALLLSLSTLAAASERLSLSQMFATLDARVWGAGAGPAVLLVAAALLVVYLAENARIPIDDPNTHLELTMIHEVMVLDHSGPDFALVQYAAALKLWLLGALLVNVLVPLSSGWFLMDFLAGLLGLGGLAVIVGGIESTMARLRLVRVPQFLIAASILAVVAMVLIAR